MTILVTASMTGKKKCLVVVGTAKRPRSFPHTLENLPVDYFSSKNAWMTGLIWEKWLRRWDQALSRKICLLVDNCTSHPKVSNLKNIEVVFLPPNTTSIMQPMDQGCIKIFKGHYR